MLHKKSIAVLAVLLVFAAGIWVAAAGALADQRAVLAGEITQVVAVGTVVSEGSELARVTTLAGTATAARANVAGVVKEVLVQPGSRIESGDIVVRLEVK